MIRIILLCVLTNKQNSEGRTLCLVLVCHSPYQCLSSLSRKFFARKFHQVTLHRNFNRHPSDQNGYRRIQNLSYFNNPSFSLTEKIAPQSLLLLCAPPQEGEILWSRNCSGCGGGVCSPQAFDGPVFRGGDNFDNKHGFDPALRRVKF